MNEVNNAVCCICGKGYHVCKSCRDAMILSPWKTHTDTSEHYKIYQIIRGFNIKLYTKEEAKERLQKVDLSDIHELRENIKATILGIMNEAGEDKRIDCVCSKNEEENNLEHELIEMPKITRKRKSSKVVDTE